MSDNLGYAKNIVKSKIDMLKVDYKKLEAVDSLLGKDTTETKKLELLSTVFVLQDIYQEIVDEMCRPDFSKLMEK